MYTLLVFLLLAAALVSAFGRFWGATISIYTSILFLTASFLISLFIFYEVVLCDFPCEVLLFNWFDLFSVYAPFTLTFDKLSTVMVSLVIFISVLIHIYASNYMGGDPCVIRFFFYLSLFTFFMCLMVLSGSLIQFFFAWEGVGLSSYLLINFWYTRAEANRAAMKAMIVNRFGDFGLYFATLLIFAAYKTLSFSSLNAVAFMLPHFAPEVTILGLTFPLQDFICFFLFVAVVGKSAQLGLHTWLPDAMEGPTPVSALLHAATMVTAGVYLLLRLSHFMEAAPGVLLIISFWGALTAFFAATVGAFQNDIKKVIAYSTCSQLGYMIAACGMHNFVGSFYHLFNHAFFKALLFLGAGSVIHALIDEQDMRKYGRLINALPLTYICMFIASLSLAGVPFLSGHYSKDIIINWAYTDFSPLYQAIYWLLVLAAFFTAYYSTKLLWLTFFSHSPRFSRALLPNIKESDLRFTGPMVVLAALSIISGYFFYELFIGYGGDFLNLAHAPHHNYIADIERLSQARKFFPLLFVCLGAATYLICHAIYVKHFDLLLSGRDYLRLLLYWKNLLAKKWFFDFFYFHVVDSFMRTAHSFFFKSFDKGIFEDLFVRRPVFLLRNLSVALKDFQTADINQYIFYILNTTIVLLGLYVLMFINHIFCLMAAFYFILKYLEIWKKL